MGIKSSRKLTQQVSEIVLKQQICKQNSPYFAKKSSINSLSNNSNHNEGLSPSPKVVSGKVYPVPAFSTNPNKQLFLSTVNQQGSKGMKFVPFTTDTAINKVSSQSPQLQRAIDFSRMAKKSNETTNTIDFQTLV